MGVFSTSKKRRRHLVVVVDENRSFQHVSRQLIKQVWSRITRKKTFQSFTPFIHRGQYPDWCPTSSIGKSEISPWSCRSNRGHAQSLWTFATGGFGSNGRSQNNVRTTAKSTGQHTHFVVTFFKNA